MRGIAILLVLGFHSGHVRGGWLGIDLFFVLSGFLITSLLLDEWIATRKVSLRSFYRRRAHRLLPALLTMLAVYGAFALASESRAQLHDTAVSVLLGLTYTMNIHNYFVASGAPDWALQHLWTLSTEEQFYLLWPPVLVLLLIWRSVRPRTLLGWLCGGLLVAGAADTQVSAHADAILVGCLAGIAFTYGWVARMPNFARLTALLVLVPLAVVTSETGTPLQDALVIALFAVACTGVVLALICDPGWWFSRLACTRPLRYTGRISYGLYLWHLPMAKIFMSWTIGLPVTFLVAALSYRYIERPFLRRRGGPGTEPRRASSAVPSAVPTA